MVYAWQNDFDNLRNDPFVFEDPVLGMEEGEVGGNIELMRMRGTGEVPQTAIRQSDIVKNLPDELDQAAQTRLALEMFLNVDSAYSDASEVFDDDGNVNQENFISAVQATLGLAAMAGPAGLNTTTKYLDILQSASAGTDSRGLPVTNESLMEEFRTKSAESPFALSNTVINKLMDTGFSNVLGRGANKREQQAFTEMILELGDSVNRTDVAMEAEKFARTTRPNEAKAMDLTNAASSVMRVLGMGV